MNQTNCAVKNPFSISQIFQFLLLFIYYIFELFFHILVESTNYIQKVNSGHTDVGPSCRDRPGASF